MFGATALKQSPAVPKMLPDDDDDDGDDFCCDNVHYLMFFTDDSGAPCIGVFFDDLIFLSLMLAMVKSPQQ